MEDLNKQQLILLVLLVSFVTSIATGIITVSLLDKAPVAVSQTINRIVERTVETVVPDNIQPEEKVVTIRETVVVTEEDRVVDAISKNKPNIIRIIDTSGILIAIGVIRSSEGEVVTINGDYSQSFKYKAQFENGEEASIDFTHRDEQTGAVYFKISTEEDKTFETGSFSSGSLQLGQVVVAISGQDRNTISTGLVADIVGEEQIVTDIDTSTMSPGTILINLSGDVVALLTRDKVFIPIKKLLALEPDQTPNTAAVGQTVQ